MEDGFDCQKCGACCISDRQVLPGYVGLAGDDPERMRRLGLPVVEAGGDASLGTVAYEGLGGSRICVAFAGTVGARCGCTIYEDRPLACQRFPAGSFLCRLARWFAGLGPEPQTCPSGC